MIAMRGEHQPFGQCLVECPVQQWVCQQNGLELFLLETEQPDLGYGPYTQ